MSEESGLPVPVGMGIFDPPTAFIPLNATWAGYLDGLLSKFLYTSSWYGTDDQIDAAIQEVEKLLVALANVANTHDLILTDDNGSYLIGG